MVEPSKDSREEEITVRLLFFGAARDAAAGHIEAELKLPVATKAADAFESVLTKYPDLRRFGRSLLFAVNQEYADKERIVENGDELASCLDQPPRGQAGLAEQRHAIALTQRHGFLADVERVMHGARRQHAVGALAMPVPIGRKRNSR